MIDVILPCLNEAEALPWVLARFPGNYRVIVADNGSVDGSADVAAAHGAEVVVASPRGFGAAVHAGLLAATSEVVCVMDADGSLDPAELGLVSDPVAAGEMDLVLGRRRPTERRAWPVHARAGNAMTAWWLRAAVRAPVHDIGPMRAFRRRAMLDLALVDRRFGYPFEMVVRAARAGWRLSEVDVTYAPRRGGQSKVTGSVRGTLRAAYDMSRVLAR